MLPTILTVGLLFSTAPARGTDQLEREARAALAEEASPPGRLALLAQEALGEGRARLAFELLDGALERAPDHPRTLELLDDLAPRVGLDLELPSPAECLELQEPELAQSIGRALRAAGRLTPSLREVAVVRLRDLMRPDLLREVGAASLYDDDAGQRACAALALRRTAPGAEVEALLERSLLDPDQDVRKQASAALAHVPDGGVAAPAVRLLDAEHPLLRVHAAQALGWMGKREAVAPLAETLLAPDRDSTASSPRAFSFFGGSTNYLQDFDVDVATSGALADPRAGNLTEGALLDVRVLGASGGRAKLARRFELELETALVRITGDHPGDEPDAWQRWWSDARPRYQGAPRSDR
jgi:hypothetical protein